jgi:hypothetical protein
MARIYLIVLVVSVCDKLFKAFSCLGFELVIFFSIHCYRGAYWRCGPASSSTKQSRSSSDKLAGRGFGVLIRRSNRADWALRENKVGNFWRLFLSEFTRVAKVAELFISRKKPLYGISLLFKI